MRAVLVLVGLIGAVAEAADYKITEPDGRVKAYVEDRGSQRVIRAPDGRILGYADERRVLAPDGRTLYYLDDRRPGAVGPPPRRD